MKKYLALGAVMAVGLVGCGNDRSREDAHDVNYSCTQKDQGFSTQRACVDKSPKSVIAFHNDFSNVATSCDGFGHRIYVTTAKRLLVIADPSCKGYTPQTPQGPAETGGNSG